MAAPKTANSPTSERLLEPGDYYRRTGRTTRFDGSDVTYFVYGHVVGPCRDEDLPVDARRRFVSVRETSSEFGVACEERHSITAFDRVMEREDYERQTGTWKRPPKTK